MAVDPTGRSVELEDPQTWNRYVYARNNPLLLVDPDGKFAVVGSRTHQSQSEAARVQPRLVRPKDVVQGNFRADAKRLIFMGNRADHLNTGSGATGSATDTRVVAGTQNLGNAITAAAAGRVEAAGEALGASHHSFQDLIGHGGASRSEHYSSENGGNMDSPDSPGFDMREGASIELTSQVNNIFNQSTIAVEGGNMTVTEAVSIAQSEAAAAAQSAYSSTSAALNNQVEGY